MKNNISGVNTLCVSRLSKLYAFCPNGYLKNAHGIALA